MHVAVGDLFVRSGADRVDGHFEQTVALKVVSPRRLSPESIERFRFERQILADLAHPSIAKLLDGGISEDGMPYLAMELVNGRPLDEHVKAFGLSIPDRLRLMIEICDALEHAHRRRVVHLDLKPSNILVDDEGRPKVLDFGIAQLIDRRSGSSTSSSSGRMTPQFAAPEQLRGEAVTSLCDLYSLGALTFLLMTGRLPFLREEDETIQDFVHRVGHDRPPNPSSMISLPWPEELDAVVAKAMHQDPLLRYSSPADLADDLSRLLEKKPVRAMPADRVYFWRKHVERHPRGWAAGTIAALVTVALLLGWWREGQEYEETLRITRIFSSETERLESVLRYAYALPAHDVRREKSLSRQRMERLREQMSTLGPLAEGPGHLALGRAELMLHRPEVAREHLAKAWDLGLKDPETAFGLGTALGTIYNRQRGAALEIRDSTMRQLEIDRLVSELRDPALELLAQVDDISEIASPSLVAAQIALLEERNEEALGLAQLAEKETPWLPTPWQYRGRAWLQIAQSHISESSWNDALGAIQEAVNALEQASLLAPSDTSTAELLCDARVFETAPPRLTRKPQDQKAAREACSQARDLDPDLDHALLQLARLHVYSMQDPSKSLDQRLEDLDRGLAMAEEAATLRKGSAEAAGILGSGFLTRALYSSRAKGLDPRADLKQAALKLQEAIDINPGLVTAYVNRAIALAILGEEELKRGEDPDPTFAEAADSFEQALDRSPTHGVILNNMANLLYNQGRYRTDSGMEAESVFRRALEITDRSLSLNPDLLVAHNQRGAILEALGNIAFRHGEDPESLIKEAQEALDESLRINPDYVHSWVNRASLQNRLANLALRRNEDPSAAIEAGLETIRQAEALSNTPFEPLESNLIELLLLSSRYHQNTELGSLDKRMENALELFPKSSLLRSRQVEAGLFRIRNAARQNLESCQDSLESLAGPLEIWLNEQPNHVGGQLLALEVDLWRTACGLKSAMDRKETLKLLDGKPNVDIAERAALKSLHEDPTSWQPETMEDRLRRDELTLLARFLSRALDAEEPGL